mmetsp:Transcript_42731/g.96276  ORF Transcript_42731/g.96276 Transcript_42731/m.96276 type:complete len:82 (+) Transcript_42731:43-288(+)
MMCVPNPVQEVTEQQEEMRLEQCQRLSSLLDQHLGAKNHPWCTLDISFCWAFSWTWFRFPVQGRKAFDHIRASTVLNSFRV